MKYLVSLPESTSPHFHTFAEVSPEDWFCAAHSVNRDVVRADGLRIADLLDAILPLFELDSYVDDPLVMMAAVEGDQLDPAVEVSYRGR